MKNIIPVSDDIVLKAASMDFYDEIVDVVKNNQKYLAEFLPWAENYDPASTHIFILDSIESFKNNSRFDYSIFYQNKFVGACGSHIIDYENKKTSIGYWLAQDYQGKGIITQSCKVLIKELFESLDIEKIELFCDIKNTKSQQVAERLGFKDKILIKNYKDLTRIGDYYRYVLLKEDYYV